MSERESMAVAAIAAVVAWGGVSPAAGVAIGMVLWAWVAARKLAEFVVAREEM